MAGKEKGFPEPGAGALAIILPEKYLLWIIKYRKGKKPPPPKHQLSALWVMTVSLTKSAAMVFHKDFDNLGKTMRCEVDLSQYPPGIYFMEIYINEHRYTVKLVAE